MMVGWDIVRPIPLGLEDEEGDEEEGEEEVGEEEEIEMVGEDFTHFLRRQRG